MISKRTNDPTANYLDRCRELIAKHGHMVQVVGAEATMPAYAYTAGLTTTFGFELVIFGMSFDMATMFLNGVAKRLKEAPVGDGADITGVANVPLRLQTFRFDPDEHRLGVALRLGYTPNHIRIVQWPDKAGAYPGSPAYRALISQSFDDGQTAARH